MARYVINQDINDSHNARRVLIGAPLTLALLFSLGFVTLRTATSDTTLPAANHPVAAKTGVGAQVAADDFAPIALAETSLPTMNTASVTSDSSVSGTVGAQSGSVAPQTAGKSSATASTSPQSATASGQSISPSKTLIIKVSSKNSLLTNLLR